MPTDNQQQYQENDADLIEDHGIVGAADRIPADDNALDDAQYLTKVLQELGADDQSDGFVTVWRKVKEGGKTENEFMDRFGVDEFSVDVLRETFGAGRFAVHVYRGGGRGIAGRRDIRIGKMPDKKPDQTQQESLLPIVQAMQAGFEKLATMLATQKETSAPAQTRAEMLREMQMMRELFGHNDHVVQSPPPQPDAVALLKMGIEMARTGAGDESNNTWLNRMIDQFGPLLAAKFQEAQPSPAAVQPAISGAGKLVDAGGQNPAILNSQIPEIETGEDPMNLVMIGYIDMLKNAAKKEASVEEYADSILSAIPSSELEEIEKMLAAETWREQLSHHTNAVMQYPEWFGKLRDTLLRYIKEDREHEQGDPDQDGLKDQGDPAP